MPFETFQHSSLKQVLQPRIFIKIATYSSGEELVPTSIVVAFLTAASDVSAVESALLRSKHLGKVAQIHQEMFQFARRREKHFPS